MFIFKIIIIREIRLYLHYCSMKLSFKLFNITEFAIIINLYFLSGLLSSAYSIVFEILLLHLSKNLNNVSVFIIFSECNFLISLYFTFI